MSFFVNIFLYNDMPLVANIGIESEIIGKHTLSYYLIATYAWLHSLKLIDFYIIAKLNKILT